jgi:prepilin-type N-terminal cleavage/methylation domain-containing protein/prepilin-type processing-associated H-X9-DG protein
MKTTGKSAFTLLELLVVIGIIGILMGVALTQFGGSTESAKASQCATNMRNLVMATHTCALANTEHGWFPSAGSFDYAVVDVGSAELVYHHWVSWISGSENRPKLPHSSKQSISFSPVSFNDKNDKLVLYALTNGNHGAMWKAMNANRSSYQCPVHAAAAKKANGKPPGWSYAMNCEFGYQKKGKSSNQNMHFSKTVDGKTRAAEKLLMFAELQGADIDIPGCDKVSADLKAGPPKGDAVLEYVGAYPGATAEKIGFNHKLGARGYFGNVAFADGHVDKLLYPKSGKGISLEDLTKALCCGHEISFNGSGYEDLEK